MQRSALLIVSCQITDPANTGFSGFADIIPHSMFNGKPPTDLKNTVRICFVIVHATLKQ